jgi:hypothetical protein
MFLLLTTAIISAQVIQKMIRLFIFFDTIFFAVKKNHIINDLKNDIFFAGSVNKS